MISEEGKTWLRRRVRVFAGWDHQKQYAPMAEGVVVGYAPHPTIVVRSEDGRQSDWMVTLPIEVLEEDASIPTITGKPVDTTEELTELRAIRKRLEDRIQSLGMDAHVHGRELRMLDEILGEI